jgi:hypothetical protein
MKKNKSKNIAEIKIPKVKKVNLKGFEKHNSSLDFSNPALVREFLLQHFIDGEHDTFFEILALYIDHIGKTRISLEAHIPERTVYNFIKGDHKTSSLNVFKVMKFISEEIERKSA